ncbi:MAG: DUF499 domain-containing protein [Candidatus Njordarchaeia archaeon]
MGIKSIVRIRDDVFEPSLDESLAPSLFEVYFKSAHQIYTNAAKFFDRTYISESMRNLILDIINVLSDRGGRNIHPLFSLFGGGKTHTLIFIYHAFNDPKALAKKDLHLSSQIINLPNRPELIVLDCDSDRLAPSPIKPLEVDSHKIQTIWGILAYRLGSYDVLKEDDKEVSAPSVEALKNVFANRYAIILLDEVAKYVKRFRDSDSKKLQKYANSVVTFIENLAKAVENTKVVLILTLPVEFRKMDGTKETIVYEKGYEDVAGEIHRRINRITSTYDVPLSVDELVHALKKRIFKEIKTRRANQVVTEMLGLYGSQEAIFGEKILLRTAKMLDYYPFHPAYVEILYELTSRVKELQRTRDALKITRKVVRLIWDRDEDPYFVMPWHIDLRAKELKGILIPSSLRSFDIVLNRDLFERVKISSNPELAYIIGLGIFLKTYTYGSAIKPEKVFPTKFDVAFYTYEKSIFEKNNWDLPNIIDLLDELSGSIFLYLQKEDERYWFTPYPPIIEIIEERASEILEPDAIEELKTFIEQLYEKNLEAVLRTRRRTVTESPKVLDMKKKIILDSCEAISFDERRYVLVTCVKIPSEEDVYNLIYTKTGGTPRQFKNTIVLIYPGENTALRSLLDQVKKFISAEEIKGQLDEFYPDQAIREVQKKRLINYENAIKERIFRGVLGIFNKIAYPVSKDARESFDVVDAKSLSLSLTGIVEKTLASPEISKIAEKMSFEYLKTLFEKRLGMMFPNEERYFTVGEIINYFYVNPRLPFASEATIKEAIKDGIRDLEIGILRGNELFWKKIFRKGMQLSTVEKGSPPSSILNTDQIIPWKSATKILIERLLEKEQKLIIDPSGRKKKIEYFLSTSRGEIPLRDFTKTEGLEPIIKNNPIIMTEEIIEEDVFLEIHPNKIVVKPGEEVTINVNVRKIGKFDQLVRLSVSDGILEKSSGKPDFNTQWRFKAPKKPKRYTYEIALILEKAGKKQTRILTIDVKEEKIEEWIENLRNYENSEIIAVECSSFESFKKINDLLGNKLLIKQGKATVQTSESKVNLGGENVEPEVLHTLIKDTINYLGFQFARISEILVHLELKQDEKIIIDKSLIDNLSDLKSVKYLVRKAEGL